MLDASVLLTKFVALLATLSKACCMFHGYPSLKFKKTGFIKPNNALGI